MHLDLLSVFHLVFGGLAVLGLGFLLIHYMVMSRFTGLMESGDLPALAAPASMVPPASGTAPPLIVRPVAVSTRPAFPKGIMAIFRVLYIVGAALIVVAGILNVLAGIFLRQRRHRTFCMVIAGLDCLQIPFGTVLGIFTLVVLSRPTVALAFEANR